MLIILKNVPFLIAWRRNAKNCIFLLPKNLKVGLSLMAYRKHRLFFSVLRRNAKE